MCLICIELVKHRMNTAEAERAATEIVETDENASEHVTELQKALEALDLEKLGELLDEGIKIKETT